MNHDIENAERHSLEARKAMPKKLLGFDIVIDPTLPDGMAEVKDGDKLLCRIVGIAPNANITCG